MSDPRASLTSSGDALVLPIHLTPRQARALRREALDAQPYVRWSRRLSDLALVVGAVAWLATLILPGDPVFGELGAWFIVGGAPQAIGARVGEWVTGRSSKVSQRLPTSGSLVLTPSHIAILAPTRERVFGLRKGVHVAATPGFLTIRAGGLTTGVAREDLPTSVDPDRLAASLTARVDRNRPAVDFTSLRGREHIVGRVRHVGAFRGSDVTVDAPVMASLVGSDAGVVLLLVGAVLLGSLMALYPGPVDERLAGVGIALAAMVAFVWRVWARPTRFVRAGRPAAPGLAGVLVGDRGLAVSSRAEVRAYAWSSIAQLDETDRSFLLRTRTPEGPLIIPKAAFRTESLADIRRTLRAGLGGRFRRPGRGQ